MDMTVNTPSLCFWHHFTKVLQDVAHKKQTSFLMIILQMNVFIIAKSTSPPAERFPMDFLNDKCHFMLQLVHLIIKDQKALIMVQPCWLQTIICLNLWHVTALKVWVY